MQLARWVTEMEPSFLHEIMKLTGLPDMINFAGGLPAPELFPVAELAAAFSGSLMTSGRQTLQYSISEGDPELRRAIAAHLAARQIPCGPADILITNGSQHGLDLIAKALLEPGDVVLMEDPTYLGAIQAFQPYRPNLVAVATDDEGMVPEALAAAIARAKPKLVYVLPTFQNPRGTSMSRERRAAIAEVCRKADLPLVEDDPYGELRYSGEPLPGLRHYWDQAIYLGTFSKTMAPGLRLGWTVAPPALMPALRLGLQATCLNIGALVQRAAATVLQGPEYKPHLAQLRATYAHRNQVMQESLAEFFPPGTTWSRPEGGLFLWVNLPDGLRVADLLAPALKEKVAFVPGMPFFVNGGGESSMRLNFSNSSPEVIREGVARLGRAVKTLQQQTAVAARP